jgi:hypothetical protein
MGNSNKINANKPSTEERAINHPMFYGAKLIGEK